MSRVGETGVGEMGIGETGVGKMGVGETGPNHINVGFKGVYFTWKCFIIFNAQMYSCHSYKTRLSCRG